MIPPVPPPGQGERHQGLLALQGGHEGWRVVELIRAPSFLVYPRSPRLPHGQAIARLAQLEHEQGPRDEVWGADDFGEIAPGDGDN